MFSHIVLYKLKDRSEESKAELKRIFLTMPEKISQIKELRVGTDILCLDRSFDVSLSILFESKEAFLEYKDFPYHKDEVVPYVHSVVDKAVSVDSNL